MHTQYASGEDLGDGLLVSTAEVDRDRPPLPTPEPTTGLLMGFGLMGLALLRRSR